MNDILLLHGSLHGFIEEITLSMGITAHKSDKRKSLNQLLSNKLCSLNDFVHISKEINIWHSRICTQEFYSVFKCKTKTGEQNTRCPLRNSD